MSYYPVVGDICHYDSSYGKEKRYLVLNVREEMVESISCSVIVAHLLCLNDGAQYPEYQWPRNNDRWFKVA